VPAEAVLIVSDGRAPELGFVPAVASGSSSSAPAISFVAPSPAAGATTSSSVQFAFTFNRTPSQTKSLVCTLAGPASSSAGCNPLVASGSGSQSGKSYTGLPAGSYTFTARVTLSDGQAVAATRSFSVAKAPQTISFTAPTAGIFGGSDSLSATGGASGNPVVFSVDSSSGAGVCSVTGTNGTTVDYTGVGNCVIDANQPGSALYAAATQVQRTIPVGKAMQTISFAAPTSGTYGGSDTLSATGGVSGNPVVFSVDSSSGNGVCSVSGANGTTVNYSGVGSCVIDANQAGNGNYRAATQIQGTIPVGKASQTISFTGPPAGTVGGSDTLSATGGASGNPVVFTVDSGRDSGAFTATGTNGTTVNYTGAGNCVIDANQAGNSDYNAATQTQQTITVTAPAPTLLPEIPAISITNDAGDVQTPVIPPDPATNNCPAQQFPDGGCAINDLDGTLNYTFDASQSIDPNTTPNQDQIAYHWQIFYPPIFGPGVVFSDAGITGYHTPILHIAPGSLPELASDSRTAGDPYWRAELTITTKTPIGTTINSVFFRFIYDSQFSLDFSTNCLLSGQYLNFTCSEVAPQLLPDTNPHDPV
jgi:hypothetical protein